MASAGLDASAGGTKVGAGDSTLLSLTALRARLELVRSRLRDVDLSTGVLRRLLGGDRHAAAEAPNSFPVARPSTAPTAWPADDNVSPALQKRIERLASWLEGRGLRGVADKDDMIQAARIALLCARETFTPGYSSWETYALTRARGAMLDEVRRLDHVPRVARFRARRAGTEADLPRMLSVQALDDGSRTRGLEDRKNLTPFIAAEREDVWRLVDLAAGARGSRVVRMYFREGRTLKEIGRSFGFSEGWASMTLGTALEKLARRLTGGKAWVRVRMARARG